MKGPNNFTRFYRQKMGEGNLFLAKNVIEGKIFYCACDSFQKKIARLAVNYAVSQQALSRPA